MTRPHARPASFLQRETTLSEKKTNKKSTRPAARSAPAGPMDVDLLAQIVKLMQANDLNTVDLRDGDKRIVLKSGAAAQPMMAMPMPMAAPQHAHPAPPAARTAASPETTAASAEEANLTPIKSPMVGTFYSAASPDAKPFVSVGSTVDDDTDVCVIEAMKVFNNIKAETHGTIAKIMVTNGQPVEYGQVLFLVKPS